MMKHFEKKILHKTFFLIFGTFLLLFFSGCKKEKGCTDKTALNYNNVAEENDGSCKYCNLDENQIGNRTVYIVDDNFSSQYYNQQVAKFKFIQVTKKYNDQKCGSDECAIGITIQSLVNKQMEFTYSLYISGFGGPPNTYVIIDAYQTIPQDSIAYNNSFTPCESINNSTISLDVSNGYIIYH